ncbi:hypothetical protein MCOR08_000422 [Pyricularia oryzae]|nr:hypothetical protein MCOR08_000422 [Pyricularia oryzae]
MTVEETDTGFFLPAVEKRRGFHSQVYRDHDENHGEDVSRHKEDLLNKHKNNSANWKSELASNSEEAVKADRDEHGSIKDLQEKTKGRAEQDKKA